MHEPSDDYRALREGAGALWLPRDAVRVAGPDAATFLQGQLSQDVLALAAGGSAWSFLLQPQGKVDAFVRVTRLADDDFVLDTDGGSGDAVVARLQRFRLRVKADVEPLPWRCVAVRGPRAHEATNDAGDAGVLRVVADWPGLPGVDLLGESPAVPDGVPLVGQAAYERARIEAGVPVMGRELDDRTIPAESGVVDRSVSFTKGCYTGQELVARIDSRGGNVPRRLRGLVVDGAVAVPTGAAVEVGGEERGRVTSSAAGVALAYVQRAVDVPAPATVRWDGGSAEAEVRPLPLVA